MVQLLSAHIVGPTVFVNLTPAYHLKSSVHVNLPLISKVCVYPLNKRKIDYWNVEMKIPF